MVGVGVPHGGGDGRVPEEFLHGDQVNAGAREVMASKFTGPKNL